MPIQPTQPVPPTERTLLMELAIRLGRVPRDSSELMAQPSLWRGRRMAERPAEQASHPLALEAGPAATKGGRVFQGQAATLRQHGIRAPR
jgi:hypothetical protein